MAVRRDDRRPGRPLFLDISYRDKSGRRRRHRRDAVLQTMAGARAEERRLLVHLAEQGELPKTFPQSQDSTAPGEPRVATFGRVVTNYSDHRLPTLHPSTRRTYQSIIDGELLPRFREWAIQQVEFEAAAELDADRAREGVGASTRRNTQIVLRAVLKFATNVGALAVMPKLPKLPKVGNTAKQSMSWTQVDAILAGTSDAGRIGLGLIAFAGLRPSEVRGLKWADVDLAQASIRIRRGVCGGEEAEPKAHHQRLLPIAEPLQVLLELAAKKRRRRCEWVAVTSHGLPWGDSGLKQAFERAAARAGVTGWSVYDLRRFFATDLARLGVHAAVIQQLLGHDSLSTTQRYIGVDSAECRQAISRIRGNGEATQAPATTADPE